jgi:hypothetical protein
MKAQVRWVNPHTIDQEPTEALQCQSTGKLWLKESILTINGHPYTDELKSEAIRVSHFGEIVETDNGEVHFSYDSH